LRLFREIGDREGEAWALAWLGAVDRLLGRYQHAVAYLQQALALFQEIGGTDGESRILVWLGEVYLGLGRYEQVAGNFEQVQARHHWQQALTCYAAIGAPEADEIRVRLAMIAEGDDKPTEES
jgi:tetratricopeptide (TPR) repeat protein